MTSSLERDLLGSNMFKKDGNIFVSKVHPIEAQEFINNINSKFSIQVIRRLTDKNYEISIPDSLLTDYIVTTNQGKKAANIIGLHGSFRIEENSWNQGEFFMSLNYPEVTEITYDKLKEFLLTLNPNFKVQEVDNLSTQGLTELKSFLISVRTLSKFSALSEEVAHVLIEMLPNDNPLKKELIDNVINFPIYSKTFEKYKDEYLTPEGIPDYNKIKREAAAKLVSEYIYALSTQDESRLQVLAKPKQNFIQRWFGKFLKWLGLGMRDHTKVYADIAGLILSGKNDQTLKTAKEIEDLSYTDSYFYRMSDEQLFEDAIEIITKKPPKLLEIISNFSKQFGRAFNEILKEERFAKLNEELKKQGDVNGRLNQLTEIQSLLGEAKMDLKRTLDADAYLRGVKQFLEAVDRLETLSDAILKVIGNKEKAKDFDEAIQNIKELEGYFGIYETFSNTISKTLAQELVNSEVGANVVKSILSTKAKFDTVNTYILAKLQNDLFLFYREMLSETNQGVADQLAAEMLVAEKIGNKEIIKSIKARMKSLIESDEKIIAILAGNGRDIDAFSNINHWVNASIINGDLYISGMTKYIQDKINRAQQKAKVDILKLFEKIDGIQEKLGETAEETGKKISFIEKVLDPYTNEERDVLSWLQPFKGIQPALEALKKATQEALDIYTEDKDNEEKKAAFVKARGNYSDFLEKFFNRPFVREYYEFRKRFDENPVFAEAMAEYQDFTSKIKNEEAFLLVEPERDDLWENLAILRRQRANLLNEVDLFGDPKPEDEIKMVRILKEYFEEAGKYHEIDEVQTERSYLIQRNKYEQKIDFAIQTIRTSKLRSIQDIEKKLREILQDKRIRIETLYELTVEGPEIDYDFIKKLLMERWYRKNISIRKNEKFYEREKEIVDELKKLQDRGELTPAEIELTKTYEDIRNVLYGSRDDVGEINPDSLTEDEKNLIFYLEDLILDLKDIKRPATVHVEDMSPEHREKYEQLEAIIADPSTTKSRKNSALNERASIANKYKDKGKNKLIKELYEQLGGLSEKKPTQYYWDTLVQLIPTLSEFVKEGVAAGLSEDQINELKDFEREFTRIIDEQDFDTLDFEFFTNDLFKTYLSTLEYVKPSLYNWFKKTHVPAKVFDPLSGNNGRYVTLPFVRSGIYVVREPVREEHQEIVYNKKYIKRRVKDEYRTGYNPDTKQVELKVGVHISNRETVNGYPEFLPLSPEQGEPKDSPYHNKAYYDLRDSKDEKDQLRFQYLETLKEADLKAQDRVDPRLRRWMLVPVMGLSNIEQIKKVPTVVKENWETLTSIFKKSETADALAQVEGDDTIEEIDQITQTIITDRLPKLGMAQRLPIGSVSRDLLKSTALFTLRSYEFEARTEASPVTKSILRVLQSNETNASKFRQGSNKNRLEILEKIYSQMVLQEVPDSTLNSKQVRRVAKFITGNTALRMLADPIGGAINYLSATVNNVIEASAHKYMSLSDFGKGNLLATEVTVSLAADFGKKSNLSYNTLLFDYFDFLQGEFEEDLLDRSSSLDKKVSWRQILMIPRKNGELHAQTATAMGILERQKVEGPDGKLYPVHKIYKKVGNTLALKEGFPKEWDPVEGKKFFEIKELINRVNLSLHGNYAKINQTEASRHALGKLAENMKRWFMPALQRRFGRETPDITLHELDEGYYRTAAKAGYNVFSNLFHLDFGGARDWMTFFLQTPANRQNLQRAGADFAQAFVLFLTFAILLGYSGDDKNKELEKNSWIHNTAILIALRVYSETTAYIPIPPWGFQEMKRNVLTPFSLPADAISNFAAIAQLGLYQVLYWFGADSLKDQLYYEKDSGFWFSEKGDSKLLKYFLKTAGYTGYTLEPAQYIETFDNLQKRLK